MASRIAWLTTWALGISVAAVLAPYASGGSLAWIAGAFLASAVAGVLAAYRLSGATPARPVLFVSGALLTAGIALPGADAVRPGWEAAVFAAAAAAVTLITLAAGGGRQPAGAPAASFAGGSAAVLTVAGTLAVPAAISAMFPPLGSASSVLVASGAAVLVLAIATLTGLRAPVASAGARHAVALALAALAAGAVPAALHLTSWAAPAMLTIVTAALLATAIRAKATTSTTAVVTSTVVALSALAWLPPGHPAIITELAVLAVMFAVTGALARATTAVVAGCGVALAALTGLAWEVASASGWPASLAALLMLAVAVAAIGAAALLRRSRGTHSLVLDLGGGVVALLAAALAAHPALAPLWHTHPLASPPLAVVVLAACAGVCAHATTTWRGTRPGAYAAALALPIVAAPAALAAGLGYQAAVGLLLAVTTAYIGWAAVGKSLAVTTPVLVSTSLLLAWAAAHSTGMIVVLSCLTVCYLGCAWRARLAAVVIGSCCMGVLAAAALAWSASVRAGLAAWQAGLAVLAVGAVAQFAAGVLARAGSQPVPASSDTDTTPAPLDPRGDLTPPIRARLANGATEATAWPVMASGVAPGLARPDTASLALLLAGVICIAIAARPARRPALWAGLALCEAAWCLWLAAAGVRAPEPYTLPVAAVAIIFGWLRARQRQAGSSWLTYGPGIALALLPSLTASWQHPGWIRPTLLGVAAAAVAVTGARARLQAPLLLGGTVLILDAAHQLAPEVRSLTELLPGWVPIALIGAALLWAGATYEARLHNLRSLRKTLAAMH